MGCAPVWLKGAEADGSLVLRVLEVAGEQTEVSAEGFTGAAALSPYGLVSLKLGRDHTLTRCDGLERDLE